MNRTSLAVPARTPLNQRLNSYREHGYTKLLPGCALGSHALRGIMSNLKPCPILNSWSHRRLFIS